MACFSSLPLEIQHDICELLVCDYRPSIFNLVLVSKHFHAIASRHRFHHLKFRLSWRERLARDVQGWTGLLEWTSAFSAVHSVTFRDDLPRPGGGDSPTEQDSDGGRSQDELTSMDQYYHCTGRNFRVHIQNDYWMGLPTFLRKLSGLRDLIWACTAIFPPCLFQALNDLPYCRLHIMSFKLPSLRYPDDQPRDIDPYDLTLATSPRLSRVTVQVTQFTNSGNGVDYTGEAMLELIKLAPNLKHIHIVKIPPPPGIVMGQLVPERRNRPPWRGLFEDSRLQEGEFAKLNLPSLPPSSTANIHSLSLNPANDTHDFRAWERHIAFSQLQTLQLWNVSAEVLHLAAQCQFPALETLALDPQTHPLQQTNDIKVHLAARDFVASLTSPLRSIYLSTGETRNPIPWRSLQIILGTHGSTLEKLSLAGNRAVEPGSPPLTLDHIQRIKVQCPSLRYLGVAIRRTKGDTTEVALYRELGTLPNLRDLSLRLECVPLLNAEGETRPRTRKEDEVEARDLFINFAIDEKLVRSIFGVILSAQPSSLLRRLRIEVVRGSDLPDGIEEDLQPLQRSWKCIRVPRGPGEQEDRILVQEVGARNRDQMSRRRQEWPGPYESVYRELWPAQANDWRDDWHSFPLELA